MALVGRRNEVEILGNLASAVRGGECRVLVLRGPAGIGKTALLEFLIGRAAGCRMLRAVGVESEMELPYAGLHQWCGPHLHRLPDLPRPQRDALGTAFRLRSGPAPDPSLVGLAVLTLLGQVADEQPVIAVVDDCQWLDQASAQAIAFVARRLAVEPIGLVLAVRDPGAPDPPRFAGLPAIELSGLDHADAAALLASAGTGGLDPRVRDRILAECQGNPLALLELTRGMSAAELAFGGAAEAAATPLVQRLEQGFLRQAADLPAVTRHLLLLAATDPVGDVGLLGRAAARLGIDADAAGTAGFAGLLTLGDRVRFRHPLVRSAIYRSAGLARRRAVHRALAEATDPDLDPDRRAWHLARAAAGPDEAVAAELERSAGRARSRGGVAAAAAFLDQAAALTPDPARRVRRCLAAARAKAQAGAFPDALALLATAGAGPLDEAGRAAAEVLRAQVAFAADRGNGALPMLLAAARRLEPIDPPQARDTYLEALSAALFAGRLARDGGTRQVAEAVRAAPPAAGPRTNDLLLDGLAVLFTDGFARAAPALHRAVRAFRAGELTLDEALRSAWLAAATAATLRDDAAWDVITRRHLDVARAAGALSALPLALTTRTVVHVFTGDLAAAAALIEENRSLTAATGSRLAPYGEIGLLAVRGLADRAEPMITDCLADVTARGEGVGVNMAQWARAVLCNGLGRYREAVAAARDAAADPGELGPPQWALAELVEAAVRSGDTATAATAAEQLAPAARAGGTDWALGVEAGRRALLHTGRAAEDLHREAIDRLGRTRMCVDLARAQLLYGEWLRRAGRRVDARLQLRSAYGSFAAMGADAFADRAGRELRATGETVRKRTVEAPGALTAQEAHIARLAAEGLTNPEIGAALFISPRTVEWHLRRIFAKLGVSTRRRLRQALPRATPPG